jgi:hypothetical protein
MAQIVSSGLDIIGLSNAALPGLINQKDLVTQGSIRFADYTLGCEYAATP